MHRTSRVFRTTVQTTCVWLINEANAIHRQTSQTQSCLDASTSLVMHVTCLLIPTIPYVNDDKRIVLAHIAQILVLTALFRIAVLQQLL